MKTFQTVLILFFLFSASEFAASWSGMVIGITDGDTIIVKRHGKPVVIRLFGVDCPEKNQDFGTRAKQFTSDMVFRKIVEVVQTGETSYGRPVAWVIENGKSLNKELIRAGLAWWYRRYAPHESELAQLEAVARENRTGLWSQPNPTPPWEFRRFAH